MLLQFQFSNYKSFKDENVFDMRAGDEYIGHIRKAGTYDVLPVATIYGANASGKSNFILALSDMAFYVLFSFAFDDQFSLGVVDSGWKKFTSRYPFKPYLFQHDKPSSYQVYLNQKNGKKEEYLKYGFSVDQKGIVEEWLGTLSEEDAQKGKPFHMIFERNREELQFDKSTEKFRENIKNSLQKKVLLITLGIKLQIRAFSDVFQWFTRLTSIHADSALEDSSLNDLFGKVYKKEISKKAVLHYIQSFDISVCDIRVKKYLKISAEPIYHMYIGHQNNHGDLDYLPVEQESAGTRKMISLYQRLQSTLSKGSVLWADELDIKIHPLLMRNIIINFTDPERNPHNAQLIFTTHNPVYLDMGLLRRDEIWFIQKDDTNSELYSLDDIRDAYGNKVSTTSDLAKKYLLGEYGAVPYLNELMEKPDYEEFKK